MITTKTKIILNDIDGKIVTLSSFSLTHIHYTFDIWLPEKKYNEICLSKIEIIRIFKVLKNFIEGNKIQELNIQDYDSPSTIKISSSDSELLSIELNLTFPSENTILLKMNNQSAATTLDSLKEVLCLIDDKEYEEEMKKKYGMDFSF